ncbi:MULTISPECIES: AraC family transcriptional regulator [Asticcacaulis]|uniref:AraC family transcriptional regulator n=1 Tax=Asticcacaulis TaxID=76890 RepID=UPI001AE82AAF|nr:MULTISPECIES: AraC family transcriptional regulator [Asticcacaulis]MBP2158311.1 AraC-like DNA-binding protein [Asticcacaulis solisilvae]MDR6799356.1 AraC-like DNA-binding protein [Asticcacaulis sp. BE141]
MADTTELAAVMRRHAPAEGMLDTAIDGINLIRSDTPTQPIHVVHVPALCIIAQGSKTVRLQGDTFTYAPGQQLSVAVDLPLSGEIIEATSDHPYLCLKVDLDPLMLAAMLKEAGVAKPSSDHSGRGLAIGLCEQDVIDAATRLVKLLDTPATAKILAPLAIRELLYRLILSGHAEGLRHIAFADSRLRRIGLAINWITRNFREPFAISSVAAAAGMSPSSLHAHFKAVTALTPLQYQKRLRLQEAQRLIYAGTMDAASAAFHTGYDSPSQFSRDYRRVFGAPPIRDVTRLRQSGADLEVAV